MTCQGSLSILVCLSIVNVIGWPYPGSNGEEARKVLGSSVVTSVSVIMDHGNGTKTYVSDGTTQPLPKPQRLIGTPADLMEPDRYEFYTFDETGDLVKRLMTLEEIQSLIAAGGDSEGIVGASMPSYYDQNSKPNSEQTLQTMESDQNQDVPGVHKIVQNVQNVLKSELAASQAKPFHQIPDLSMPDAASSWSILFPNVLEDSLHSSDMNHLSDLIPEATPNLNIPPSLKTTQSPNIPNLKTPTSTQAQKYFDREPTTTESSLIIHYLPINAIPSKTHNKKPNRPPGGSYDKYKPVKDSSSVKTTYFDTTSSKPSSHISTWSTLVTQSTQTTKQYAESIKLNPQLSDSFSSMLQQVTENPQNIIDDKYTKPSSAIPTKFDSSVRRNFTSIPVTTTMKVPNPVGSTTPNLNKYKNGTKTQNKNKKPVETVKLNITKPVSTYGTTAYNNRISESTSKPSSDKLTAIELKNNNANQVSQTYQNEFKNSPLLQSAQQSSSLKNSQPIMTTPYNANVKAQTSTKPNFENFQKDSTNKIFGTTPFLTEISTKIYNPTQYVNNQPVMSTRPVSLTHPPSSSTIKYSFFTTPDENIFSEPFVANASTKIYNPPLYINNQPVISTKPVQFISPLRQSTTPMHHLPVTDSPQIISSQSYVSKPNPFLTNSFQTTPKTSQFPMSSTQNSFERIQSTTINAPIKTDMHIKKPVQNKEQNATVHINKPQKYQQIKVKNTTNISNEQKPSNKPIKSTAGQYSTEKSLTSQNLSSNTKNQITNSNKNEAFKNNNVTVKVENSAQKIKVNTTSQQNKNKVQLSSNTTKSSINGNYSSSVTISPLKTNTPLPPKSNTNRPNGNFSIANKQNNNTGNVSLKANSSSDKHSQSSTANSNKQSTSPIFTKISHTTVSLPAQVTELRTVGSNKENSETVTQNSISTKINKPDRNSLNTNQTQTKKPPTPSDNLKESSVQSKNKTDLNNEVKLTNKRPISSTKQPSNSTRIPEISTKKSGNKTSENLKNSSKAPPNSQNQNLLKVTLSSSTTFKPLSTSQHNFDKIESNIQQSFGSSIEPVRSTTQNAEKSNWSTTSDLDRLESNSPESTIYIRVNTTNPTSTDRSSQTKINFTRLPESTTAVNKFSTNVGSDYNQLDHIVHDGISAVTNMLQYSPVSVTPALYKNVTENNFVHHKDANTFKDPTNVTTDNDISKIKQSNNLENTTTQRNFLEIKQDFVTHSIDKPSYSKITSANLVSTTFSTKPVIGETKHASTEAIQELLNDLSNPLKNEASSTMPADMIFSAKDSEVVKTIESSVSTDTSSAATELNSLTTIEDDNVNSFSTTQQTTIVTQENIEVTTLQTVETNEADTTGERNKTLEKLKITTETLTTTEIYEETVTERENVTNNEDDDNGTTVSSIYESTTTEETSTGSDQTEIMSTVISPTLGMIGELRTEAMDLGIETNAIVSSTIPTAVTEETINENAKLDLNSTLATSTSTIQTTEPPVSNQMASIPTTQSEPTKVEKVVTTPTTETKEHVESLRTPGGGGSFKPVGQSQKQSTVELHPPPNEHMGLEASIAFLGDDIRRFADLCNELAFKMWTSLTGKGQVSSRSLVLSPFAAISTLAMVFLGARGPTSGQMNDILRLDDMVSFNPHQVLQNVTDSVIHAKRNGIDTAAFVREIYSDKSKGKILDFYKERVQQYYDGHVEEIGFNIIGDVLRRRTNLLVKRQTQGKVPEYLRGSTLGLKPPLAAFTANIFQTECERASTEGRDGEMYFVVRPSTRQRRLVPVPAAVWRTGFTAGYEPGLDATAVSLNHGSDNTLSSVYVLPGQQGQVAPGDGLVRLEQRLIETSYRRGGWSRLLRSLLKRPGLELQLPRFSHRSVLNVTATLQRMGLKDVFNSEKADLRGLNGIPNDLHLSDIIQVNTFSTCAEENIGARHHIETFPVSAQRVGREDTRTSDTSILTDSYNHLPLNLRPRQGRIPDAPRLRFDRPFLYLVRHNPTGMILYMGRFNPRLLA